MTQPHVLSKHVNEVSMDLLGAPALNSFVTNDSSSRVQMFCSHIGQALNVQGANVKRILSGIEREYGKYTFSKTIPTDATIIKVIPRYPFTLGVNGIRENPETLVIYEDMETKVVGCILLPRFHSVHQYFGFRYVNRPNVKLTPGESLPKGTIIADSPSIDEHGNYRYGVELNVAFMSVPQIIEDGVVISHTAATKLTTKAYGKRIVKFGKKHFPLNTYPLNGEYRIMPDIGDRIREDGLIFALREHDPILAIVNQTPEALETPDYIYDKLTYGEPGGKIIDIRVWSEKSGKPLTPHGMEVQIERYAQASSRYYENIREEYRRLAKRRNSDRADWITPEFQRVVTDAIADTGKIGQDRVQKTYRMVPLDEYRVEIIYEYELRPTTGFKLTDIHGGKGVVCDIWPDEDMPIDLNGNRAEIIMDGDSTTKRMNPGRFIEHYINGASRDVSERTRLMLGLDRINPALADLRGILDNPEMVEMAFSFLQGYYTTVSPWMAAITEKYDIKLKRAHVEAVVKEGVYLWMPTNNPKPIDEVIVEIDEKYPQLHGPVTYRGRSGNVVTTRRPVFISTMYIMLLEKTGENYAAVSSAKLQHWGIPAKLTNEDKHSAPARQQPVRTIGESEARLFQGNIGSYTTADLLDQSNNPLVHKEIVGNILRAEHPTNINRVIDRHQFPIGGGRPLVFFRHVQECGGIRYVRKRGVV